MPVHSNLLSPQDAQSLDTQLPHEQVVLPELVCCTPRCKLCSSRPPTALLRGYKIDLLAGLGEPFAGLAVEASHVPRPWW